MDKVIFLNSRTELLEWVSVLTHQLAHFTEQIEKIKKIQAELVKSCEPLTAEGFTFRGNENVESLTISEIFTYEKSCLMNYINSVDINDFPNDADLCRKILPEIDTLLSMIKFLINIYD